MKEPVQFRSEFLHQVRDADQTHLEVRALHSLHQRAVMRWKPQRSDHIAAVLARELGKVDSLVTIAVVGEKGHFKSVAAAAKQPRAGAGKVTRVSALGGGKAFVYGIGDQR